MVHNFNQNWFIHVILVYKQTMVWFISLKLESSFMTYFCMRSVGQKTVVVVWERLQEPAAQLVKRANELDWRAEGDKDTAVQVTTTLAGNNQWRITRGRVRADRIYVQLMTRRCLLSAPSPPYLHQPSLSPFRSLALSSGWWATTLCRRSAS